MILKFPLENGSIRQDPSTDTQYFGKDAEDFLESINWHKDIEYLGKECTTSGGKQGIIVGFEDSESAMDYYFIVYIPELDTVEYELANSAEFVNNIIV